MIKIFLKSNLIILICFNFLNATLVKLPEKKYLSEKFNELKLQELDQKTKLIEQLADKEIEVNQLNELLKKNIYLVTESVRGESLVMRLKILGICLKDYPTELEQIKHDIETDMIFSHFHLCEGNWPF